MTPEDLQLIEQELAVSLPSAYQRIMVPFRLPALSGNTDSELWDDPVRLVALNREVRAGARWFTPWPVHFFCVGEVDGESYVAIDLRGGPEAPTWWVDHGHFPNKGSGQTHSRFEDWATSYLAGLRADMQGDGYNPDGTSEQYRADLTASVRKSGWGCALLTTLIVLVSVVIVWWRVNRSAH